MKIIKRILDWLFGHDLENWENQYGYGYRCKRCGIKTYYTLKKLRKAKWIWKNA